MFFWTKDIDKINKLFRPKVYKLWIKYNQPVFEKKLNKLLKEYNKKYWRYWKKTHNYGKYIYAELENQDDDLWLVLGLEGFKSFKKVLANNR